VELGRTVENTLTHVITKSSITLIPALGGNWTVEKYLTQVIIKEQHITQSLLS
jgi:hypothetical protein